jgi:hypothetical protein
MLNKGCSLKKDGAPQQALCVTCLGDLAHTLATHGLFVLLEKGDDEPGRMHYDCSAATLYARVYAKHVIGL